MINQSKKIIANSPYVNFKYAKGKIDIYGNMFHNYYEVYLFLNGNVDFINDHTHCMVKPYQLVIIPPGEYHQFVVKNDIENYERCVLNIYPELLGAYVLHNALKDKEILNLSHNHRIVENFLYIKDSIQGYNEDDFSYILSAITTDIVFLIKKSKKSLETSSELDSFALEIINYINENYKENITLTDISNHFFISVSSLCHIFKENFGISIKKYIIEKRMSEANLSIRRGNKPQEVANLFGFSNYSTFYREYKKHFGFSPAETIKTN